MSRWSTHSLAAAMIARTKTVRYAQAVAGAPAEDRRLCTAAPVDAPVQVSAPETEATASVAQPKSRKRGAK